MFPSWPPKFSKKTEGRRVDFQFECNWVLVNTSIDLKTQAKKFLER